MEMQRVTKLTTLTEVLTHFALFYKEILSEFDFTVWATALKYHDLLAIKKAFIAYTQVGKSMPKPAHILEKIRDVYTPKRVASLPREKYVPDQALDEQYEAALFEARQSDITRSKAGWAKMQELRIKMGAHYQAWARRAA